jgi:A/G-specific adenine glycosylase
VASVRMAEVSKTARQIRQALALPDPRMSAMRRKLLQWWRSNARDFPWRRETDPYRVLIAEVLLRRTQANQVVPVYRRFLLAFPDIRSLRAARSERIRGLLRPLGLRWRADNVVRLSRSLTETDLRNIDEADQLRHLPGVGEYVESAVRCFSGGQPVPVIDTNTARVAVRLFGIRTRGEPRRNPLVRGVLVRLLGAKSPKNLNWALLDLAAQVCRARIPSCSRCPLEGFCCKTGVVEYR